jgi:hypothetical protein
MVTGDLQRLDGGWTPKFGLRSFFALTLAAAVLALLVFRPPTLPMATACGFFFFLVVISRILAAETDHPSIISLGVDNSESFG